MKTALTILLTHLILINSAFAAFQETVCQVDEPTTDQQVFFELSPLSFKHVVNFEDKYGETRQRWTEFLSPDKVSSYKIPVTECTRLIDSQDPAQYKMNYFCQGVEGGLTFNQTTRSGTYFEILTTFGKSRTIRFKYCR